jgi:hypothetical protein
VGDGDTNFGFGSGCALRAPSRLNEYDGHFIGCV